MEYLRSLNFNDKQKLNNFTILNQDLHAPMTIYIPDYSKINGDKITAQSTSGIKNQCSTHLLQLILW